MILPILGLGLAAYMAWVGIMSATSLPPILLTEGGLRIPDRKVYSAIVIVQYVIIVGIILALTIL